MTRREVEKLFKNLGQHFKYLRKLKGLTGIELSRKLNLTQAQVSRIETAKQGFSFSTFLKYCEAFELNPSDVLKKFGF